MQKMNVNKEWVEVLKNSCSNMINTWGKNIDHETILSLESLIKENGAKALERKWLVLFQVTSKLGFDARFQWESTNSDLNRHEHNAARMILQILHNAKNEVISIRITKCANTSPDLLNMTIKAYAKHILEYLKNEANDEHDLITKIKAKESLVQIPAVEKQYDEQEFEDNIDLFVTSTDSYDQYKDFLNDIVQKLNDDEQTPSGKEDDRVVGDHGGVKLDGTKAKFGLVPPDAYLAVAEVMTAGALKYSANNWVGLELSRVLDALERHINAFRSGEELAADSKQHHMAHVIANAMMAYHITKNKPEQDDRLFKYLTSKTDAYPIDKSNNSDLDAIKNFYKS